MCLYINPEVKSMNKHIVWKVFDRQGGKIVSLYMAATYPKGRLIQRSGGSAVDEYGTGEHGLHFYLSKAIAKKHAAEWPNSYIAKFAVVPKDFMYISVDKKEAMYERATRVGNYIRVKLAG
jgi:hypothetical protein